MQNKLFFFLLFLSFFAQAQSIRLEGTIQDTLQKALEMANVMAINQETKAMDSYAITNDKGRFQLNLKTNSTYKIKVSYIGFQSLETTVETKEVNLQKIITLKEGDVNLDGVEVVHEMPVSISGDTIIYNADSFKTGTEKKLEDILKKLPGVEVNADGEIEVEGKKVTQLLVDGKKFFEGDTKLGAKNIPSDAVDKVQVLRNYTEVSQLRGLENNNEDVAINIKLKKGKNKFWFGDISAGVGPDERYIINPKLFYYSPKTSINVISNFNNIGDVPFSLRDYFRLTGASRNTMSRNGTNFNVSSNDLGISTQRNDRAEEIDTKFGAVNITQQMSKTWNLSGFAVLSADKTKTNTQSRNEYYEPNSTEIETEEKRSDISDLTNNLAIFKIGSKYKPSAVFQFDYDVSLKRSNQKETNVLETTSITDGTQTFNSINSFKKQDPITLNQSLNMFWTQSEKSTWAFEIQHLYQDEDPLYNPQLLNNPFPFIDGIDENQSFYNINQSRFVKTNRIDAKADYYYSLTAKSNLNLTFGNTYSFQTYTSSIFQILDNGAENNLNEAIYNNDVQYSFNDAFLGAHYKFITGKFTFNPGLSFHRYSTFNDQLNVKIKDNFSRVLPDLFAQYQLKKSESLTYNYRMNNVFSDINSFAEGFTFNNFNSLNRGNSLLENALQQTHSLRYFKYNLFNYTTIFGNLNYVKTTDPVINRAFFNGIYQTSEKVNANFENESINGMIGYQRSFLKYYKGSLGVNLNWSKFNTLRVNPSNPTDNSLDFVQTTESFSQTYRASMGTQYKTWPNLEVGYTVTLNDYQGTTFKTQQPFAKLDYFFLNGFAFDTTYDYYQYTNSSGTVNNTYDFLNSNLSYRKKDAKLEYRLGVTNMLNTKSLNDDSFNQTSFRTSQYLVQPRYVVFSLKYNL
ncbi:carboxypeptidase-like regulatory domain-containing protein [Flavobacterium sp.]|uniref:carboxypeptidase-like regulatory domain-containing protein n=1 Tax=Flavobacterium sp. TaxID=239 RepID=UPI00262BFFE0|nr:carboxypeptidase-like regulatory domain-containing protein [Flavobacterium sp.]MDD2985013.1 carboxypeptidase-like regulatory domain-containing protein [Flavobacterium sp.]